MAGTSKFQKTTSSGKILRAIAKMKGDNLRVMAVIPARGGSKGIPRKNVRFLQGKPLLAHAIEATKNSEDIDDTVVSSDDTEILEYAKAYGARVLQRPDKLAGDEITIAPVIHHAVENAEKELGKKFELVVILQPTLPLIKTDTLEEAIGELQTPRYDSLAGVISKRHIYWSKCNEGPETIQSSRENRQSIDPIYQEVGFFVSRRDVISKESQLGRDVKLFEVPPEQGIDIDDYQDWLKVDYISSRPKIGIRVDGDTQIGLGHIYRMLTVAKRFFNDELYFFANPEKRLGFKKIKASNFPIVPVNNEEEFLCKLESKDIDILINDILDTDVKYISELNEMGLYVVNFEDIGEGSKEADLVFNALYENSQPPKNHFYGPDYICLKDEFQVFKPTKQHEKVGRALVTFGGTDPNNLTLKTIKAIQDAGLKDMDIDLILGLGYKNKKKAKDTVQKLNKNGFNIQIQHDVQIMAKHISQADIAVTSNGRTIYEVASLGVPCISISQNEREARHLFAHLSTGILNIGMASNITAEYISSTLEELVENFPRRKSMHEELLSHNLLKGTERVVDLIKSNYEEWRSEKY